MTFDAKNSISITNAKLYYSPTEDFDINTATFLGASSTAINGEYSFDVTSPIIPTGNHCFFLLYDVSNYAFYGTRLDARVVSFELSNGEV
jgi:hypothetical protein